MKFLWQPVYLYSTLGIFLIELCLALFVRDSFFRPFVGDILAVILLYCFFKIGISADDRMLALGVWTFACLLEVGQYFQILNWLGWQDQQLLRIVLGSTFDGLDILAYSLGCLTILVWIHYHQRRLLRHPGD